MSESVPSLVNLAAGLITAGAEEADPALVNKVTTVVNSDVTTFTNHNQGLIPLLEDGTQLLEGFAEKYGFSTVVSIMNGLFPFLAAVPHQTVAVPDAPAATPAVS